MKRSHIYFAITIALLSVSSSYGMDLRRQDKHRRTRSQGDAIFQTIEKAEQADNEQSSSQQKAASLSTLDEMQQENFSGMLAVYAQYPRYRHLFHRHPEDLDAEYLDIEND